VGKVCPDHDLVSFSRRHLAFSDCGNTGIRAKWMAKLPKTRFLKRTSEAIGPAAGIAAQRVSYMTQISASETNSLRVAHVCRAVAGLQPPSPMDNRRARVSREESTGEERWGSSHGHAPRVPHTVHLPASLGLTPSFRHVQQQACGQAVRRCQVACAPARACSVRRDMCGRRLPPGALLHPGRHATPSYKSATSLRLASVSPSM
jgi:hypothetical protein